MNRLIKIAALLCFASLLFWLGTKENKKTTKPFTIGIVQVIDHPALDQSRQGILDELKEKQFLENCTVTTESAQGNPALASQIVQKFVGQKASLIVAIGTTPAQAAAQITQNTNIPVVFVSVTDPVGAKLIINPKQPEGNVTGVSNFVPIEQQFELFKKLIPTLKKLGIIYNPGEANSVSMMEKMQLAADKMNLTLVPSVASKTGDVPAAAKNLMGKVDAVFVNNDNTALAAFDAVSKTAHDNKTAAFVSDLDLLNHGALAVLGPNQYEVGKQAAVMIVQILRDKTPVSKIPAEGPKIIETKVNEKVAQELGVSF